MAVHRGAIVMYVTATGSIPAVTTAHYTTGTAADVAAGSATSVDLVTLAYNGTKLTGVLLDGTAGTFANIAAHTTGKYYVPS